MVNVWMAHVAKTRKTMPAGTPLKAVLKAAKKTY